MHGGDRVQDQEGARGGELFNVVSPHKVVLNQKLGQFSMQLVTRECRPPDEPVAEEADRRPFGFRNFLLLPNLDDRPLQAGGRHLARRPQPRSNLSIAGEAQIGLSRADEVVRSDVEPTQGQAPNIETGEHVAADLGDQPLFPPIAVRDEVTDLKHRGAASGAIAQAEIETIEIVSPTSALQQAPDPHPEVFVRQGRHIRGSHHRVQMT